MSIKHTYSDGSPYMARCCNLPKQALYVLRHQTAHQKDEIPLRPLKSHSKIKHPTKLKPKCIALLSCFFHGVGADSVITVYADPAADRSFKPRIETSQSVPATSTRIDLKNKDDKL